MNPLHQLIWNKEMKELNDRNDCKVIPINNSGHWMMFDNPELVNQEVENFLHE